MKNKKRSGTRPPASFSTWVLKKNILLSDYPYFAIYWAMCCMCVICVLQLIVNQLVTKTKFIFHSIFQKFMLAHLVITFRHIQASNDFIHFITKTSNLGQYQDDYWLISLAIGGASNTPIHFFYFFLFFVWGEWISKTVLKTLYLFWANIIFWDHFVDIRYLTYYQHQQEVWKQQLRSYSTQGIKFTKHVLIYKWSL